MIEKSEKIIFLDIDGVLNSSKTLELSLKNEEPEIMRYLPHPLHLAPLKKIIDATGAKCVISSTWRIGCSKSNMFTMLFASLGFPDIWVIDTTPVCSSCRGDEIQEWLGLRQRMLDNNSQEFCENWNILPIGNFVILDDDSDMLPEQRNNFVHVHDGLTDEDAEKAINILKS